MDKLVFIIKDFWKKEPDCFTEIFMDVVSKSDTTIVVNHLGSVLNIPNDLGTLKHLSEYPDNRLCVLLLNPTNKEKEQSKLLFNDKNIHFIYGYRAGKTIEYLADSKIVCVPLIKDKSIVKYVSAKDFKGKTVYLPFNNKELNSPFYSEENKMSYIITNKELKDIETPLKKCLKEELILEKQRIDFLLNNIDL